jgi:GTP-binding protein
MPQTRFVLRKALALGLHPIVVINKMDREHAKPHEALDRVFSLFIDLGATDPQMDFPVVYASGREGWASLTTARGTDVTPLLDTIVKAVPAPFVDPDRPLQMLVTMLDYNNYVGRIGIGRVVNGRIAKAETVGLVKPSGQVFTGKVARLERFFGLERREVDFASAGDVVAVAGLPEIHVGDTVTSAEKPEALPPLEIDEPTLSMEIMVNNSPFAGREGKFVTGRHLRDRLLREKEVNVGLRVEALEGEGHFKISGRGELHLSILIETMRREGYELAVARPEVIFKESPQGLLEPMEYLVVDIPTDYQGTVIESMGRRNGKMVNMAPEGTTRTRLEYEIASRALMGFKSELMTTTRGMGLMHHAFHGYGPKGPEPGLRSQGVFVAKEGGRTTGYALASLQEHAQMFLGPGVDVYEGMVVGLADTDNDFVVNPCKAKAMSNMRSKASDEAIDLTPPHIMTLEQSLEFIDDTELVEATPQSIRLRKKILNASFRKRDDRRREEVSD